MSGSKAVTVALSRSSMCMKAIKKKKKKKSSKEATKFKESKAKSKIANENKPSS